MEEKMRRDKNRNRVKDDGSAGDDNAEEDEVDGDDDTEAVAPENTTIEMNNDEYQIDDDDQIHNIDNAMQQGPDPDFHEHFDHNNQFE